jgi:hypothetical protein
MAHRQRIREAALPETDILNPAPGFDPVLGDSMNPSYGFSPKRASTQLRKKAIGGTPWTRETQNTGHALSLSWLGRTYACVQRLKWYYEQYEDGFFTIVDWDGGGRHYVGRFTSEVSPIETANNKWDVQNVTFEEMPKAPMVEYPSDWAHDAIAFFVNNDFGDQKLAFSGAWTQTAQVAIGGSVWTAHRQLTVGAAYLTMDNPGTEGDWATYEYRGYGFKLYMLQGPEYGKADVYVDGVLNTTIDLYNAADLGPQVVLELQSLSLDIHRVKVIADGTKNADATDTKVSWYALEVMR